jgi:diguanylate cyclase (GGDEF)-like protein/PAS domain S-box-containing protein
MARVLIVDDQAANRELVATLLRYRQHEPVEAADGQQALTLARAQPPDLVICDILMPVMDGFEFVRCLRADPQLAHTEVIFYTATFLEHQARELATHCGVEQVLVKPCEPEEILAAVETALSRRPRAPLPPPSPSAEFDRQHLRLVTDKLLAKVSELEAAHERLAALVDSAMDAIVGIDAAHQVVLFNPAAERMFGYREAELLGQPLDRLLPEAARALHGAAIEAFGGDATRSRTMGGARLVQGLRRTGEVFPIEASIAKTGLGTMRFSAILRDVSERQATDERIRRLARVSAVLSDINALIVRVRQREELFHEACRIAVEVGRFNKAWIGLLDASGSHLTLVAQAGADLGYFDSLRLALQEPGALQAFFVASLLERQPSIINDLQQVSSEQVLVAEALASGSRALAWLPLSTQDSTVGVLVLHADAPGFFDEEELRLLKELAGDMSFALEHIGQQEHLLRLAHYDTLTGLANESLFRERLALQIHAVEGSERQVAVVLVDLMRFKRINDTLGRQTGDQLLRQVAERMSTCLGDPHRLARVVADRFAAVIVDVGPEPASGLARALAAQYQQCFGTPFLVEGEALRLDARIGIAIYPDDGRSAEALLRHAEAALKSAKSSPDPIVFYHPRMSAAVAENLALENQLRRALERDEFVLHYQPKVDMDTRRILGLEALLRWNSPELGLVPPIKFIGLLEETGLIVPVGMWVIRQAARDHRAWLERFGSAPPVAVNVSAVQLHREGFVQEVSKALQEEAATRASIDLEVTESLVMQDVEGSIAKLQALRAMDMRIAIDDFGTGYSSLAYLSKLPAQLLKIDRSFIGSMLTDPDSMTLVSTMISLAHSLRMQVVAEGVETEEQAKILRLLRCDQMQGYLVCRPVAAEQIALLLAAL